MNPEAETIGDIAIINEIPDFVVDLLNEFTIYYKQLNNLPDNYSMIGDISTTDVTNTNKILEEFYDAQTKYAKYEMLSPDTNKLYSPDSYVDTGDEMFGISKNDELILVSQSLFAVLIELVNLKRESNKGEKYSVVPIRRE